MFATVLFSASEPARDDHAAKLPLNAEQQAVINGRIEALRVGLQTEATRP